MRLAESTFERCVCRKKEINFPPLREGYKLIDQNQKIFDRFREELDHRLGGVRFSFSIYKENLLTYPSIHADTVVFEITVGGWRRSMYISEIELDNFTSGSFYHFCRRMVDNVISDLIKIGASRA